MKRPNLYLTETRLRAAFEALGSMDPDAEMTPEQAEEFLRQYVDPAGAVHQRDEFAEFILDAESMIEAKKKRADDLRSEALRLENGIDRMKASVVKLMTGLAVDELRGETFTLKVKRSRGAVDVVNEGEIPPEFWRVKQDEDMVTINALALMLEATVGELTPVLAMLVEQAKDRRRTVDKKAIQQAWKDAGGAERPATAAEIERLEGGERALALVSTPLLPVVPGAVKVVTSELVIT